MSLRKQLVKRRGLQPKKPLAHTITSSQLEKRAREVAKRVVQRRPAERVGKKSRSASPAAGPAGPAAAPARRRPRRPAHPGLRRGEKRNPKIETVVGKKVLRQPRVQEALIRKGLIKPELLSVSDIEGILKGMHRIKSSGSKKKKTKKPAKKKGRKGGEVASIDARYTRPLRPYGIYMGEGIIQPAQAYGSLNPPINYGELDYLTSLPPSYSRIGADLDGPNVVAGGNFWDDFVEGFKRGADIVKNPLKVLKEIPGIGPAVFAPIEGVVSKIPESRYTREREGREERPKSMTEAELIEAGVPARAFEPFPWEGAFGHGMSGGANPTYFQIEDVNWKELLQCS